MGSVFVHIVTYNSASFILACLEALHAQDDFVPGENLRIRITDNNSTDRTVAIINERFGASCELCVNNQNLGFCGAHNQGAKRFLDTHEQYFLILNPDVRLRHDALKEFVVDFPDATRVGMACGKLYRADDKLQPLDPARIDSTGIIFTSALRHLDRGAGEYERGQYAYKEFVAGGTGACLFLTKPFVESVSFDAGVYERAVERIYPQLADRRDDRISLFDEAFFAYREDADLAWRAKILGWRCLYMPGVVGYHRRRVTPELRDSLPPELNLNGVRNRFLLQLNNYSLALDWRSFIPGVLLRNAVVIAGVLMRERSSAPAFSQVAKLFRRALARRKETFARARKAL